MTTTRRAATARLATVSAAAVLVLAACGTDESDDTAEPADGGGELVIADSGDAAAPAAEASDVGTDAGELVVTDEAGGAASDAATAPVDEEEQALAFAACMRDEGIDWPDPTVDADGSIDLLGGLQPGAGGAARLFSDQDSLEDGFAVCGSIVEGASFLPEGGPGLNEEQQDQLLEVAECLREQGLDVDDPDLSALGAGGGGPAAIFGDAFDPTDPAVQDAIGQCQGIFVGGPGGGFGGGGN